MAGLLCSPLAAGEGGRSPARSEGAVDSVPTMCGYFVVSSWPLRNTQQEYGACFVCAKWAVDNGPCVTSVAKTNPDQDVHGNGHVLVRVYARLKQIK